MRVNDEFLADKAERTAVIRRHQAATATLPKVRAARDKAARIRIGVLSGRVVGGPTVEEATATLAAQEARVQAAETEEAEALAAMRARLAQPGPTVAQ